MQDPCDVLDSVNFGNEEQLKTFLLRDKHTRIEGLFTEVFFCEEVLSGLFRDYTTGWWFTVKNNTYFIIKFTLSVPQLNALDLQLLELFAARNPHVFIVEFCEPQRDFYYGKYVSGMDSRIREEWERTRKPYPRNRNRAGIPAAGERDPRRLNQAIGYLQEAGVLKKCAIERMFANCWLGNAFFWDIDYCVRYGNRYVAFEVKQKFPTAKGTFGLNTGLANLFLYLESIGISVVHVILQKPVNDISIPAIDLYMKEEYRKNARWIATRFSGKMLRRASTLAPSYTSIHGNSQMAYYHLAQEEFSLIKAVGSRENNLKGFLDNCFRNDLY